MNVWMFMLCCWQFSIVNKNHQPQIKFSDGTTLKMAHRGLTSLHLENTWQALSASFEHGLDGVEFDVQLTRDLVPVVFHDENLKRLFKIKKNINDLSWAELMELRQSSDRYVEKYAISSLQEILLAMPKNKLINVELKETTKMHGMLGIRSVLDVLKNFKDKLTMVVSSFDPEILQLVHSEDSDYSLGLLIDSRASLMDYIKVYRVLNKVDFLHPHISLLNKTTSKWIKKLGTPLILWGHKKMGQEASFIADGHLALISDVAEDFRN